jgi:hypothetical protein
MTKTILVTLVLFQVVEFKTIKVFDMIMKSIVSQWPEGGRKTSEKGRAPPLHGVTGYFILARRNRFGAAN